MNKQDFMNEVIRIYYRDNCDTAQAIETAEKELNVSDKQVREWFAGGFTNAKTN